MQRDINSHKIMIGNVILNSVFHMKKPMTN